MKFSHLFYDSEVNFKAISKRRVVLSVLLGLSSAFIIYSFYYGLRETDRLMFPDFENRPLIITENERYLHNFFFSAISLILGNSLAINFLFSGSQSVFSRRNIKRSRLLNDQMFLGFNFIHWFTKIWFLICVFSWQTIGSEFTKTFMLPSVLLIAVLYLDAWKTLIQVIKKNRFKIQIIHFSIFMVLTFLLSRIHSIDYKTIDKTIQQTHSTIDVPVANFKEIERRNDSGVILFRMDFDDNKNEVLLYNNNKIIEFSEIRNEIVEWKKTFYYSHNTKVVLRADRNIPIKAIKYFEYELLVANIYHVTYETDNLNKKTAFLRNNKIDHNLCIGLVKEIQRLENLLYFPYPFLESYENEKLKDTLEIKVAKSIFINDKKLPVENLSDFLTPYINPRSIIQYTYDESTIYQDYIDVLSSHKKIVRKLRDIENYTEIEQKILLNQFKKDEKLNKKRQRLRIEYPINITEKFNY